MRYLKFLGVVALFFLSMFFLSQNNATLVQELTLELKLFDWHVQTEPLPFYLLILLAFVFGALLSTLYFFLERIRLSQQNRHCRKEIAALERELASLRPKPVEEPFVTEESTENIQN